MLTLDANFTREMSRAGNSPTVLVNVGGLQKFVLATRNVLGYPKSVLSVTKFSSQLDPLTCKQTLSQTTVEIGDDGIAAALNVNNYLLGKTLTLLLGFDTGSDATFPEGSYAGFGGGIIVRVERLPGKFVITANDPRTSIFDGMRSGVGATWTPNNTGSTISEIPIQGAAVQGFKSLLDATGIPSSFYNASSFTVANNAPVGHMVIERNVIAFGTDRRIKKPEPTSDTLDKIACILRGYILVDENMLIGFKRYDSSATPVDRFRQTDFDPASFHLSHDVPATITAAVIRSAYENLSGGSGDAYMFQYRDDQGAASASWGYTGGASKPNEIRLDDESFCSFLANWSHKKIAAADTTIKVTGLVGAVGGGWNNFTGCPGAVPAVNAVDASHPGYLFVTGATPAGTGVADPGEIIKFTTITDNRVTDGSWILGGLTRGMFGTTAADHLAEPTGLVNVGPGVVIIDVTPIIYCADQILQRYPNGVPKVEFETAGLSKYGIQVGDLVYGDFPLYNRQGLNGLADGNTTVKFEVLKKDVDLDRNVIAWTLMEAPQVARTPVSTPSGQNGVKIVGVTDPGLFGVVSGSGQLQDPLTGLGFANAFVSGTVPSTSASLTTTIPQHRALSTAGHVVVDSLSHAFTASKDTYVDLDPHPRGLSTWRYTEVANGAAAPAIPDGCQRAYKVVTSGTAVSSVTDLRVTSPVGDAMVSPIHFNNATQLAPSGCLNLNSDFNAQTDPTQPPDHWLMGNGGTGVWGTNAQRSSTSQTGAHSIYFPAQAAPATKNDSLAVPDEFTWEVKSDLFPVTEGMHLRLDSLVQSDAAGVRYELYLQFYDVNQAVIAGTVLEAIPTAGNGSFLLDGSDMTTTPAGTRFARIGIVQRQPANQLWVDFVRVIEVPEYGPSFPASPFIGQQFFRTDRGLQYYYDGTRWLTVNEYVQPLAPYNVGASAPFNISTTPVDALIGVLPDSQATLYLTKWVISVDVATTNTAASHWLVALKNVAGTTIDSVGTDSMGAASTWLRTVRTINSVRTVATDVWWDVNVSKAGATGTPGNLSILSSVHYRLIG